MRQSRVILYPPVDDEVKNTDRNHDEADESTGKISWMQQPSSSSILPESLQQNFDVLKKRKVSDVEANRVAEETEVMIRTEVRRMQNAVAELEAFLHSVEESPAVDNQDSDNAVHEDGGDGDAFVDDQGPAVAVVRDEEPCERPPQRRRFCPKNNGHHHPVFPALPKMVVIEPPLPADAPVMGEIDDRVSSSESTIKEGN